MALFKVLKLFYYRIFNNKFSIFNFQQNKKYLNRPLKWKLKNRTILFHFQTWDLTRRKVDKSLRYTHNMNSFSNFKEKKTYNFFYIFSLALVFSITKPPFCSFLLDKSYYILFTLSSTHRFLTDETRFQVSTHDFSYIYIYI